MTTRRGALAIVVALSLSLSACGDDSDKERAAAALEAEMVANAGMTTGRIDSERTSCVAEDMVDRLGVEKLQEYELLTDDLRAGQSIQGITLPPADADTVARVFADCMDVETMMERQIVEGLELPRKEQGRAARCVSERVTPDLVVRTMSLEFQGAKNPAFSRLRTDLKSCLR